MPNPHRVHGAPVSLGAGQTASGSTTQQRPTAVSGIQSDIRALNSSLLLLSQKMQYVVRNEKILGRNLIVLSRKIQALESRSASGEGGASSAQLAELKSSLDSLAARINDFGQKIFEMQSEIENFKSHFAKQEQLTELKFLIDTINPLEFVTLKQVNELVEKRLREHPEKETARQPVAKR